MSTLSRPSFPPASLSGLEGLPCVLEPRRSRALSWWKHGALGALTAATYVAWLYVLDHW